MAVSTNDKKLDGAGLGTLWDKVKSYVASQAYSLPTATSNTLGGIKVGSTLSISSSVLNLASSGVTAGTYKSVTVDSYGRVTSGSNPTTLSGYGITDAKIANGVITLGSNTITPLTSSSTLDATKLSGTIPAGCYTNTTYSSATTSVLGLLKVSNKLSTAQTLTSGDGTTANRFYGVQMDKDGVAFVNIPWTDHTYSFSNADATLSWSTRTKIATVGGVDVYVTMPANPNSNTWRGIYTGGTSRVGNGTDTKAMNFVAGSNVSITYEAAGTGSGQSGSANYFNVKIAATDTTYSAATTSADGLMSSSDKTKLNGIATGATAVSETTVSGWGFTKNAGTVTSVKVGTTSYSPSSGVVSLPAYPTTLPASDVYSWAKASSKPTYSFSEISGTVDSSQLPSYVDDVLEYASKSKFPTTGESGKIYVAIDTNLTWRWSGSDYVEISPSLALGETSSTAYRGDRGKTAYDHSQSTHARTDATAVASSSTNGNIKINGTETTVYTHPGSGTNPHGTTKSDVGLGNVGNFKAVSTVASQGLSSTEQSNARANIGAGTSSFSGSYTDLTNKPTIPSAANNGTFYIKTKVGSNAAVAASDFTANQSSADDVTFIQGSNVTLTTDTTNRTITIAATDTTYSAATQSANGLMSSTDKTKLDGIATGATKVIESTVSGWGFTKNAGTVTSVKVGNTSYSPSSGVVSLPAYPTTLPASDVYSWAKASTKPSYTASEVGAATSDHTHSYAGSSSAGGAANSLVNFKVTTTSNVGIDAPGSNAIGYVSGLTKATWNYQQTDGGLYTQWYNASWIGEIFQDYRTGQISVRGKNNGTWQSWRNILDSSNFTSFVTPAAIGAATSGHTHTTTIATSTGTNQLTLAFGTKYAITAGGTSYVFTMPSNPNSNTWRNVYTGGTSRVGTGTDTKAINFLAGSNVSIDYLAAGTGSGKSGSADYFTIKISATDTTYSSKAAASGGTDVSLVTTGEKYTWNNKSNLAIGTTATTAAAGNHTHTTSLATDTGTSTITLASAGKYKLTAGGTSVIFTMPTIPTVSYPVTSVNSKTGAVSLTASDVGAATSGHTHTLSIAADSGTNALTLAASTKYKLTAGGSTFIFTTPADTNTWRPIGTGATDAAAGNHTHSTSIATSTGTNQLTLAFGTKYALSAGGTSYIFTMPANPNTNTTYTFAEGSTNGAFSVTPSGGSAQSVAIHGLGSAAYTASTAYATSGHTHATSIATSTGTNQLTLGFGSKYGLTAGGTTYIFTMPSNPVTAQTTGFKITAGTTAKTLTVGADYTLGAACAKGVTDNSSATAVTSSDTNLITGRTLYYAGYTKNTGTVTKVSTGTGLTGGDITTTGTVSINSTYQTYISHGESAYNSLSSYLPLSGGTMTGNITFNATNKGYYLKDSAGVSYAGLFDNGENLWIGAIATDGTHHTGNTYISAGTGDAYISRLVSGTRTNYKILDAGNTYVSSGKGYINGTEVTTISGNAATATKATQDGSGNTITSTYLPLSSSSQKALTNSVGNWGWSFSNTYNGGTNSTISMCQNNGFGMYIKSNTAADYIYILRLDNNTKEIFTVLADGTINASGNGNVQFGRLINYTDNIQHVTSGSTMYIQGTHNGNLVLCLGGGSVGIGNVTSPSYKLHVGGTCGATLFTNTSDIRKKNVIDAKEININDIAKAPLFKFTWNDTKIDTSVHIGSSAQYWNGVTHELVSAANDEQHTLSMQYDVLALSCAISIAREVVKHKDEITTLKEKVTTLENRIKELEEAA